MAIGRKTGGNDFKPGQSGNPKGKQALPGDVKDARKLTKAEFERLVNKYIWLDAHAFEATAKDPDLSMFERMVGAIVSKAIVKGEPLYLDFLLQRLIGKVKDQVEVTTKPSMLIHRSDGSSVELTQAKEDDEA